VLKIKELTLFVDAKNAYFETFYKSWKKIMNFEQQDKDSEYKLRCHVCGELKDEWDVTVDTTTPICEYICEDCLSQSGKS
jgi:formylmethanofuran dehydrogenase subunit E